MTSLGPTTFAWLELLVGLAVYVGVLHLARWFAWGRFIPRG